MYVSIPDCFMISMFVGVVFGLVYEALRIVRLLLPFRLVVFTCDVVFFALASIVVMGLSKLLGSYVRIYTILGFGAGVFTYIVTVGRLLNVIENAASNAWRKAIRGFFTMIFNAVRKIFGKIAHKLQSAFVKSAEYRKGRSKNKSQDLKSEADLMYNKNRADKIGGRANVIKASVRKST